MRVLAIFLSVLMFMLSAYTCSGDACPDEHCASDLIGSDDDPSGDSDLCTPFCIDGCCVIHVCCETDPIALKPVIKFQLVNAGFVKGAVLPLVSSPIWQPPKIC